MRFVQPAVLLLGTAMYIAVSAFSYQLARGDTVQWNLVIAGVWNLLLLAATVIAIADGVRKVRARRTRQLATDVLVVKLVSIPFFILNFFILAYLFLGGAAIFLFGGPVLLVAAAIGSGLTYVVSRHIHLPPPAGSRRVSLVPVRGDRFDEGLIVRPRVCAGYQLRLPLCFLGEPL